MPDNITASGQTDDGSANDQGQGGAGGDDKVAYTTYKKVLGEAKTLKSKLQEYEDRERESREKALVAEGKLKEALDAANARARDLEGKLGNASKTFAREVFTREAKSVALQMGADSSAVDDLLAANDFSTVEIDDKLKINVDQLKERLTEIQKAKPFYFRKTATPPHDVNLNGGFKQSGGKTIDEMTPAELQSAIRRMG